MELIGALQSWESVKSTEFPGCDLGAVCAVATWWRHLGRRTEMPTFLSQALGKESPKVDFQTP